MKETSLLFVDDEIEILNISVMRFKRFGFNVFTASSVDEALVILNDNNSSIDVVISDVKMPNRTGEDLLKEIRKSGEFRPAVFMVTGSIDLSLSHFLDLGANGVFSKPINYNNLIHAIQLALKSTPPSETRRKHDRFKVILDISVTLNNGETIHGLRSYNIGRGGFFLAIPEGPMPYIDETLSFTFKIHLEEETKTLAGEGRVTWQRNQDEESGPRGIGVQFLNLHKDYMNELLWFLYNLNVTSFIPMSV